MSLIERLFGGVSIRLMYIRCMTFIHVCYMGTIDVINIIELINMTCFLELSPEYSFNFHRFKIKIHIMLRPDGSIIGCTWCYSLIPDLFLIVNFYLLRATFKKNILSIDMWLVLHGLHLLYMLSIDVFTNYYAFTLVYTCFYCIFLLLVISFRMEERNNSIFHKIINYLYQKIEYLRMYRRYQLYVECTRHPVSLADPLFHTPGKIELLIGADIFMDIVQDGKIHGPIECSPTLQNSTPS